MIKMEIEKRRSLYRNTDLFKETQRSRCTSGITSSDGDISGMILPSLPALDVRRFQSRKERKPESEVMPLLLPKLQLMDISFFRRSRESTNKSEQNSLRTENSLRVIQSLPIKRESCCSLPTISCKFWLGLKRSSSTEVCSSHDQLRSPLLGKWLSSPRGVEHVPP